MENNAGSANNTLVPQLPLYRQLAAHIVEAIAAGMLRSGDRLPSVRHLSTQHKVSLSTAVQTYRFLENEGVVEARPKSGYFVKGRQLAGIPDNALAKKLILSITTTSIDSGSVDHTKQNQQRDLVIDLTAEVAGRSTSDCFVRLDIATGPPEVYPTRKLQQLLSSISRRLPGMLTNYPTGTGYAEFKAQIARRSLDTGCHISPDEIIVTSGSTEALQLALRAVTRPGDKVAVESPTYFGILRMLETLGLQPLEIPASEVTGISLSALDFATAAPGAVQAVVLMPNFHNPLGSLMPDENKQKVVQMLAARDIPLIEDDVYGDLYYGERRPLAAKSFDRNNNVILCSSATKTLAPGLRIGWMVPGRWFAQIERLKYTSSMVTPELSQAAIAEFMRNGNYDHHMRKLRTGVIQQTARMEVAIRKYFPEGTAIVSPQGGYQLWVALPNKLSAQQVYSLAREQGIGIAPGMMFSNTGRFDHYIRINCGYPWSALIEGSVATLGKIVAVLMNG